MTENSDVYSELEQLYNMGLYSCVVELFPFVIGSHSLSSLGSTNCRLFQAASLQQLKEYKRAESLYKEALQAKKFILRSKNKISDGQDGLIFSELEIKFRMSECFLGLGQSNQAANILQSIPTKQRTPSINLTLAKLYHQNGMEKLAVLAYKEVLKECPTAIEAIRSLIQLGVKSKEIQEFLPDAKSGPFGWLSSYLTIQSSLYSMDYKTCVKECKKLEEKPELKGCTTLLITQGIAHHWAGEDEQGRVVLQRAASLDNMLLTGMDTLAAVLANLGKNVELDLLSTRLMNISEERPEPWIAMGHYCHQLLKYQRAVFFAHKACLLDTRNIESLLLKGNVLLDLKKISEAINHFREAVQMAPYRYEAHKGLVDCYHTMERRKEAVTFATGACKQLGKSARALTLYAGVLLEEPLSVARAKSILERVAGTGHLPAVYLLVQLLDREGAAEKAIELLRTTLQSVANCKIHQMLADLLAKNNQEEAAMEHYSLALGLDPKNEDASNGLRRIEASNDGGLEASYDMDMTEMGSSHGSIGGGGRVSPVGGRPELEDSETEAVWSDGDVNMAGS